MNQQTIKIIKKYAVKTIPDKTTRRKFIEELKVAYSKMNHLEKTTFLKSIK